MDHELKKLAIVILNWNGRDMMHRFLPSVIANSTVGDVIVADNASTDGSLEMLLMEFPDTRTIVLDQNYGFAEGYNRALAECYKEYEYLLLLNSDIEIRQHGWDSILTDYMDAHPECAACQPKLMDLKRPTHFEYAGCCGGYLDRYGYPFCRGRIMDTVEEDKHQYDDIRSVLWATGAAMLVRSTDWAASGGLDGRFFAHMEEIDLCWRLRTMGRDIVCIPQSVAYHLGGASLNYGNPRKTFLNFRNNLLMLYKNLPKSEIASTLIIRAILDWVALFVFLMQGQWQHAKAVYNARMEFHQLIPEFRRDREHIQSTRKVGAIPERTRFSILIAYKLLGKKVFSQLGM